MHLLAKYGVAFSFEAPIPKVDDTAFAASGDWTPATGDVKVSKDGGNVANITTLPTAVGGTGSVLWTWALSATEMQAARITIQVVDAAVENQSFIVQTYGNGSAQHAVDLDDSVRGGLTALPNAVADGAGGLVISDAGGFNIDALRALVPFSQTVSSVNSQTSLVLNDGPDDDNAGNGWGIFIQDASSASQVCFAYALDWDAATNTLTLQEDPGVFTIAASDKVFFLSPAALASWMLSSAAVNTSVSHFTTNTGQNAASAEDGSVVKEVRSGLALEATLGTPAGASVSADIAALNDLGPDTVLPEAFSTDGQNPTLAEAIHEIRQTLADFGISGTTLTVNKMDGTEAMTFILDDASNPTSRTRAT